MKIGKLDNHRETIEFINRVVSELSYLFRAEHIILGVNRSSTDNRHGIRQARHVVRDLFSHLSYPKRQFFDRQF